MDDATSDHDANLEALLDHARSRNIKLNADKFNFRQSEVQYAGHVLSDCGYRPDPKKVEAIGEMPPPSDVAAVRRFLGMVNYLGKYVDGLADLCDPLRQLTKDSVAWSWSPDHQVAFERTKNALSKGPVLAFFDEHHPTVLQCDASQFAVGAVLLQEG